MESLQDAHGRFLQLLQQANDYPVPLLRTQKFEYARERYKKQLAKGDIFHPEHRALYLRDLMEDDDGSQTFKHCRH